MDEPLWQKALLYNFKNFLGQVSDNLDLFEPEQVEELQAIALEFVGACVQELGNA